MDKKINCERGFMAGTLGFHTPAPCTSLLNATGNLVVVVVVVFMQVFRSTGRKGCGLRYSEDLRKMSPAGSWNCDGLLRSHPWRSVCH